MLSDGERVYHQPVVRADIIDTLGAGDSFIAGFLTDFFEHQDIRRALTAAAGTAAKTCGGSERSVTGIPTGRTAGKAVKKREYDKHCLVFYTCYA